MRYKNQINGLTEDQVPHLLHLGSHYRIKHSTYLVRVIPQLFIYEYYYKHNQLCIDCNEWSQVKTEHYNNGPARACPRYVSLPSFTRQKHSEISMHIVRDATYWAFRVWRCGKLLWFIFIATWWTINEPVITDNN